MARCLIIGCGCRGLTLARELIEQEHVVRGTTRESGRRPQIESAGVECVVGDPERVGTLVGALEHVAVAVILLGSAQGSADQIEALHGPRLEMLLTRMTDTTVRGVVYEARGSVDEELLSAGSRRVRAFGERSMARTALLEADPSHSEAWLPEALAAVVGVLEPAGG